MKNWRPKAFNFTKKSSIVGASQEILGNISEQLFCRTPTSTEAYLEPSRTSMMKRLCEYR